MVPNTPVLIQYDFEPITVLQDFLNNQYGIFQGHAYLDCGVRLCEVYLPRDNSVRKFREQDLKKISIEEYTKGRKDNKETHKWNDYPTAR